MDIKDFFSGMFSNKPKNVLQTPYGNFNLAKGKDIKRVQKMVIDLQRTTDALTRKDIKNWRDAWQYAINVDSPSRQRLYDIYRDAEIDLHLSGCVEQRRGFVMARSFKIVDMKGDENEEPVHSPGSSSSCAMHLIQSTGDIRSSNWATFALTATAASVIRM